MTDPEEEVPITAATRAALNYLKDTNETPVFRQTKTASDIVSLGGARQPRTVTIRDGRGSAAGFSLDIEGFAFATQVTKVTDFNDDQQLELIYTREIEKLIARVAGAREAVVFDHTRRSTEASHREKYGSRDPVPAPHSDYDDSSARQRMRDKFGENNHLVVTMEQGRDLAATLGDGSIALMKRHGCVVTGPTVEQTVMKAIYLQVNAKLQLQTMQLGTPDYLTDTEIAECTAMQQAPISLDRAWEVWCRRAEAARR